MDADLITRVAKLIEFYSKEDVTNIALEGKDPEEAGVIEIFRACGSIERAVCKVLVTGTFPEEVDQLKSLLISNIVSILQQVPRAGTLLEVSRENVPPPS